MGHEELDNHDIPLKLAARALGVTPRTLLDWLANGDIKGEQTTTDRWWLKVGDCRAYIRAKRGGGEPRGGDLRRDLADRRFAEESVHSTG